MRVCWGLQRTILDDGVQFWLEEDILHALTNYLI